VSIASWYQEAIDAYKEAIKIKPDYHKAYCNMGVAYGELKKPQEAIDACIASWCSFNLL
jgi:tetratricopeptide (TPR) repeat protein